MKKTLLAIGIALSSLAAHADHDRGPTPPRVGVTIVLNPQASSYDRIEQLERAVADLQGRVYDLEARGGGQAQWVCSTVSNFDKTYIGRGLSQVEAEAAARQACQSDVNGMFCKNEARCKRQ